MMLYFILGLRKLRNQNISEPNEWPKVSVIVPAHNEEKYLKRTLEALGKQNYPGWFEIICINDRSIDQTSTILNQAADKYSAIRPIHIDSIEGSITGNKKRAMQRGFDLAQGEIFLTIDGDCLPPLGWIKSMAKHFHLGADIVQGPKRILESEKSVHHFQQLETLGFTSIEGAFFSHGTPMLASAPSLAYRKSLFEKAGGFNSLMDLESGDDDMLVQNMAQHTNSVVYNADPEAQVGTEAVHSWRQLFNQHARWASNGTEYENKAYVAFLIGIYLFITWIALTPIWLWIQVDLNLIFIPILVKAGLDWVLISHGARLLKSENLLKHFFKTFFIQLYVILWAAPAGRWKWYKW